MENEVKKPASLEEHQKECATKKKPGLSGPSRFAVKTFADVVKMFDEGADNQEIAAATMADHKAVLAARSAYASIIACAPLSSKPRPVQTVVTPKPKPEKPLTEAEAYAALMKDNDGMTFGGKAA